MSDRTIGTAILPSAAATIRAVVGDLEVDVDADLVVVDRHDLDLPRRCPRPGLPVCGDDAEADGRDVVTAS